MTTLTENILVQSIKIIPGTGTIEVERVMQVLRDGEVSMTGTPTVQKLTQDMDLTAMNLEPLVLAVAAAAWTPEQVTAAAAAMFEKMKAQHGEWQAEQDQRLAGLERSRAAVAAAHMELDAEHATLAERHEHVNQRRTELFQRHEEIMRQHPQLDAMLREMAVKVK